MRIAIVEPRFSGHYFTYVRPILEALRGVASDVTLLLSPEGLQSREFGVHLKPFLGKEKVDAALTFPSKRGIRGGLDLLKLARLSAEVSGAEHLLVPSADGVAQAVGVASLLGYRPYGYAVSGEALLTKIGFTYSGGTRRYPAWLMSAALQRSPWTRLHLIDILAYQWLRNRAPGLARRVRMIPDPVEPVEVVSKEVARKKLGVAVEGRYLVCPGILIKRKGVGLLLKAFLGSRLGATDCILLAGPVGSDVASTLEQPECVQLIKEKRLIVLDEYLDTERLGMVICAGDVTVCPYPEQPHPSSIAVKSIACHRPVLGANSFWLGTMIPAFGMGWTVPVHDAEEFCRVIPRVLDEAHAWRRTGLADRLVAYQTTERFRDCWASGIKERMGIATVNDDQDVIDSLIRDAGLESYGAG
jgi:hypothetical protein